MLRWFAFSGCNKGPGKQPKRHILERSTSCHILSLAILAESISHGKRGTNLVLS